MVLADRLIVVGRRQERGSVSPGAAQENEPLMRMAPRPIGGTAGSPATVRHLAR